MSRRRDDEEQSERQPGVRTVGELIHELRGLEGIVGPDRQFGSVPRYREPRQRREGWQKGDPEKVHEEQGRAEDEQPSTGPG